MNKIFNIDSQQFIWGLLSTNLICPEILLKSIISKQLGYEAMIADGNYITSDHLKCSEKYLLVGSYFYFFVIYSFFFIAHI
jgi:hypothetical protein